MALTQHWGDGREDTPGDAFSALLAASAAGDEARAAALLDQSAVDDVLLDYRFFGETPCEQALEHGHVGVAELLVSSVLSRPHWAEQVSELFWRRLLSAAMRSRQLSVLGFVLGFEPDLNSDVRHSEKPLFDAARADEAEMLKMLLAHGADASGRDPVGSSVLHIAAKYGAMKVLDVLKGSSVREEVNAVDSLGNTALRMATPLHMAVSKARLEMAKLLLEEGQADVNATDYQDKMALLLLAAMTSSDMDEYTSDSEEEE
ncbi:hypothetical protein PF004_g28361 [Phytophthora fragariae]|uniref:Uncharacterized protein n=2 Tax=Phytophthora fragariae TaxID=53985 RepID=A0A6G0MI69_9STRA|nr:hypothetical protein PF003_g4671 [Phytophthora fragariae]KAE9168901.1 hypothetical protein PF004_g28361 [Phytophthora fragariae]